MRPQIPNFVQKRPRRQQLIANLLRPFFAQERKLGPVKHYGLVRHDHALAKRRF
jgi:hypothetical protein